MRRVQLTIGLGLLTLVVVAGARLGQQQLPPFSCVDTAASGSVMASGEGLSVQIEWGKNTGRLRAGLTMHTPEWRPTDDAIAHDNAKALLEPVRAGMRSRSPATVSVILICDGHVETWYGAPPALRLPWSDCFYHIEPRQVPGCLQQRLNQGRRSGGDELQGGAVLDRMRAFLPKTAAPE